MSEGVWPPAESALDSGLPFGEPYSSLSRWLTSPSDTRIPRSASSPTNQLVAMRNCRADCFSSSYSCLHASLKCSRLIARTRKWAMHLVKRGGSGAPCRGAMTEIQCSSEALVIVVWPTLAMTCPDNGPQPATIALAAKAASGGAMKRALPTRRWLAILLYAAAPFIDRMLRSAPCGGHIRSVRSCRLIACSRGFDRAHPREP
jgi:hypothetical protein